MESIKVRVLQYVLRRQLLNSEAGKKLSYQIGKNLSKIDSFIENIDKRLSELNEQFYEKESDGNLIYYKITRLGRDEFDYVIGEDGNKVVASKEVDENNKRPFIVKDEDYTSAFKKLDEEEFTDFHKFPQEIVDECAEKGLFGNTDLSILFGVLLD